MEKQAKVVQLKTQLVKEGHTRDLLAETDLMTLRIHCYAPGIGENALHSHTKEDHIFLVLQGTAQFNTGRDGKTVVNAAKHQAVVLPAGCYYQFCNSGEDPLVMARIGAGPDKADQRLNPDGTAVPGRTHEQGAAKPVLIEGAFSNNFKQTSSIKGEGRARARGDGRGLVGKSFPVQESSVKHLGDVSHVRKSVLEFP